MSKVLSVLDIANRNGLNTEDVDRPFDESLIPSLANYVHPWSLVFTFLLSEVDLSDIETENIGRSEHEKRIAALRKWKAANGHRATYRSLLQALLESGRTDHAESICDKLAAANSIQLQQQRLEHGDGECRNA